MSIAIALHLLSAVIWVGGMFFAYVILRPVAGEVLESESRLTLWSLIFKRFAPWVLACVLILLSTGIWLIVAVGGLTAVGAPVHAMMLIGVFMMLIFLHMNFYGFKKLEWSVGEHDWITAAEALKQVRQLILINLVLGLFVVAIAAGGRL